MDHASPASTCTISGDVWDMETEHEGGTSTIPTPDPNAAEGTIDHVLNILGEYSHPFTFVGHVALRWMGCSSSVDAGFDLVLRTSQLSDIVTSLVETGLWTTFDSPKAFEAFKSNAAWQDLENAEEKRLLEYNWFSYVRLWTEETDHIDIDASPLVEVPELYPWNPFLVEREFHPALRRDDGWFYGPLVLDDAAANNGADGIFNTLYERTKGARSTSPINILSIPAYLDVLVYHATYYASSKHGLAFVAAVQINNLTNDLFLELPHQMNPLFFQVEAETENYLQSYFAGWKRTPRYVRSLSEGRVPVNTWDPGSYPEKLISPFVRMRSISRGPPRSFRAPSTGAAAE
ncbi:hypothetical protein VE03_00648 [Pseudogymnoascus sp. 23342-1-I1]|nr:hypothetical protein VE03_00648 [Pseudogymnoascus sp. 23342-1-I1]